MEVQWGDSSGLDQGDGTGDGGKLTDPRYIVEIKQSGLGDGLGAEGQGERRFKNNWVLGSAPLRRLGDQEGQDHTPESSVLVHQVRAASGLTVGGALVGGQEPSEGCGLERLQDPSTEPRCNFQRDGSDIPRKVDDSIERTQ